MRDRPRRRPAPEQVFLWWTRALVPLTLWAFFTQDPLRDLQMWGVYLWPLVALLWAETGAWTARQLRALTNDYRLMSIRYERVDRRYRQRERAVAQMITRMQEVNNDEKR